MPKMGMDMVSGTVLKWLVAPGTPVTRGESVVEIETEKVTVVLDAPESGLLREIVAPEGATVEPGQILALIDNE
jgi:pyruvate dehydrogenase E2 component (dihydrolipoamide acetyltransferase)